MSRVMISSEENGSFESNTDTKESGKSRCVGEQKHKDIMELSKES